MIECITYCAISAVLFLLFFRFLTQVTDTYRKTSNRCLYLTSLYAAVDAFVNDVRYAPKDLSAWYYLGNKKLLWHTPDGDIEYEINKDIITRTVGIYNNAHGNWIQSTSSKILQGFLHGSFMLEQSDKTLFAISLKLDAMVRTVWLL